MKGWSEPCPKELVGDKGIHFFGCFNQCISRLLLGISMYLSFLISSFLVHVFSARRFVIHRVMSGFLLHSCYHVIMIP